MWVYPNDTRKMITIHDVKQGTPEWHLAHKDKWSGSTAIYLLRGKKMPEWSTFAGNNTTHRGKFLEPATIREFEVAMDAPGGVLNVGYVSNSKYPNAMFSPDGIFGDTLLEGKAPEKVHYDKIILGEKDLYKYVDLEYLCQIYFGMVICELKKAKLLVPDPNTINQLVIIDIPYNQTIIDNIKSKLC